MSSSLATRGFGISVGLALALASVACRDDNSAPASSGGAGGTGGAGGRGGTGGRGGSSASGGAGGTAGANVDAAADGAAGEAASSDTSADSAPAADAAGGDGSSAAMRPFFAHPSYPQGVIRPNKPQAELDNAVTGFYSSWKKFLVNRCGGRYISAGEDFGAGLATVSELQGYGMMISVIMGGADTMAQANFDGLFRVARMFTSGNDMRLMSKEVRLSGNNCMNMPQPESQTDGDMDITFALLMAEKQWGNGGAVNYGQEARSMLAAIKEHDLNAMSKLPMLGDWVLPTDTKFYWGARSSDFMGDHLRAFGTADASDALWMQSLDAIYGVIDKIQMNNSAMTGLLPDFIINTNMAAPSPAPANWSAGSQPNDGHYFYHAARLPLRLAMDYVASGEIRAKGALTKINQWIMTKTGGNPMAIVDGYRIDNGNPVGDGTSHVFEGPFGAAAVVDPANQAWLDAIWTRLSAGNAGNDSNAETIRLLSLLVISGHWWAP